jgi:hypothetical protein
MVVSFLAIDRGTHASTAREVGIGCRIGHGAEKDPTSAAPLAIG